MTQRLRRVRGATGIGLTWAAVWGGAGAVVVLAFVLKTGSRPDPPFPLMFGALGFIAGVVFSGVLGIVERHHRFERMSLPRFAAWGAAVGALLAAMFVGAVALSDPPFVWYLAVLGPAFAIAAAGSAAGSLVLARRAQPWRRLLVHLGADVRSDG